MSSQSEVFPPSPQTTLLLLLGASCWPHDPLEFSAYDGFAHGARKVEDYFLRVYGMPPAHIRSYFDDPRSGIDITKDIHAWLEAFKGEVRDLIVYYIGHAKHTINNRQLYLAIKDTQKFDPEGTSLRVESLVRAIKVRSSLRHYYIFDCCFAATAIANLQGSSEKELLEGTLEEIKLEKQGVTALFSSGKAEASVVLPDQKNTFFSEALLAALQNTSLTSGSPLSFAKVYPEINRQLEVLFQQYRFHSGVQKPPAAHLYSGNLSSVPIFPQRKQTTSDGSPQPPRLEPKGIQQITQLAGHTNEVTALAFSPDNQTLVSGDKRGKVTIWKIVEKTSFDRELSRFFRFPVTNLAFHPEGRAFFVCVGHNADVKLLGCQNGEILGTIYLNHRNVYALAMSPDGLALISAGGAEETKNYGSYGPTSVAQPSLSVCTYPRTDKSIQAENYPYVNKFRHYDSKEKTLSIAFSLRGRFFAASSSTGTIRIWDIPQGEERLPPLKDKDDSGNFFTGVAFHPEENLIAAINKESQCLIWDLSTGSIQHTLVPLSEKITAIAFSPDGYYLAAAHSNGVIGFWSSSSGEPLHSFQAHDQSISALVHSPDGYNLVSGSLDKTIKVWGNSRK